MQYAIQAAHREMKSYAMSIVYGNRSPSSVFSNPITEISDILKENKSSNKPTAAPTDVSNEIYQFSYHVEDYLLTEIKSMPITMKEKDKLTAKKVIATIPVDVYASTKKSLGHKLIVKPNVQYMALLFEPLKLFTEVCEKIAVEL